MSRKTMKKNSGSKGLTQNPLGPPGTKGLTHNPLGPPGTKGLTHNPLGPPGTKGLTHNPLGPPGTKGLTHNPLGPPVEGAALAVSSSSPDTRESASACSAILSCTRAIFFSRGARVELYWGNERDGGNAQFCYWETVHIKLINDIIKRQRIFNVNVNHKDSS